MIKISLTLIFTLHTKIKTKNNKYGLQTNIDKIIHFNNINRKINNKNMDNLMFYKILSFFFQTCSF